MEVEEPTPDLLLITGREKNARHNTENHVGDLHG